MAITALPDAKAQLKRHELSLKQAITETHDETRKTRLHEVLSRVLELQQTLTIQSAQRLSERPIGNAWWRPLSTFEQKTNFVALQETFDTTEEELAAWFNDLYEQDVVAALEQMEKKIKDGTIPAIIAYTILSKHKIEQGIQQAQTAAYEDGKASAAKEMGVPRSGTPSIDSSLMAFERKAMADAMAQEINATTKNYALEGMSKGVAASALILGIKELVKKQYDKYANAITGTVVGENVNRGRRSEFKTNKMKIKAYQRSEVLDFRTCEICLSLDQRIVKADDPMAMMDVIHSNCRGIWVPIYETETVEGPMGIPKTIVNQFDTLGGVPVVNKFKQLKKPLPKKGNETAKSIADTKKK